MRSSLALVLMLAAAGACSTDPAGGDDTGGGGGGGGGGSNMDPGDPPPPARGFQLKSPDITIMPGQEITYCWYFKTPNTEQFSIKKWASHMSEGSHHLILFFTSTMAQPEGTVSSTNCGFGQAGAGAWVYSAQNPDQELALPADDGTGNPLGMDVKPGQPAFLQLHYYNPSDETLTVHAVINAEAHEASVNATKTFAYVTFATDINIGKMQQGAMVSHTCPLASTQKVWLMSTHAHKQAVHTEVRDGSDVVFASDDWEHPGAKAWMSNPFYTFASGQLTYECTYNNPTNNVIKTGDSAATDEMCMASGYVFPATKTTICVNNSIVPF